MNSKLASYAKAAQHLRMAWLTQSEFPARPLVKVSFLDALSELPEATTYEDGLVRSSLQAIVDGPDPRSGTFSKPKPSTPQPSCTTVSQPWSSRPLTATRTRTKSDRQHFRC